MHEVMAKNSEKRAWRAAPRCRRSCNNMKRAGAGCPAVVVAVVCSEAVERRGRILGAEWCSAPRPWPTVTLALQNTLRHRHHQSCSDLAAAAAAGAAVAAQRICCCAWQSTSTFRGSATVCDEIVSAPPVSGRASVVALAPSERDSGGGGTLRADTRARGTGAIMMNAAVSESAVAPLVLVAPRMSLRCFWKLWYAFAAGPTATNRHGTPTPRAHLMSGLEWLATTMCLMAWCWRRACRRCGRSGLHCCGFHWYVIK